MPDTEGYKDRTHAGRALARQLRAALGPGEQDDLLVLGLPRGGVPVAFEVAQLLSAELDVVLVRKLGMPHHPELAMGAIGSGGVRVLQPGVPGLMGVTQEEIDAITSRELAEIERRARLYRGGRPEPQLAQRPVIIVDDGIATGSTMEAAVQIARQRQAARVIVAVPVAPPDTLDRLEPDVDELVCLLSPLRFRAVSQWYDAFDQTSDEEVQDLLALAWSKQASPL